MNNRISAAQWRILRSRPARIGLFIIAAILVWIY
jgi:hypothetical protein